MNKPPDRADVQVVVERIIAAPPARVFKAWTDPVLMEKWFAPMDKKAVEVTAEAVAGGRYRIGMLSQDGSKGYVSGIYIEIDPPRRLVFTWAWDTDPPGLESVVTVEFFEQGDSTRLVLTHRRLTTPQMRESHLRGWESCLRQLELSASGGRI